MDNLSFCRTFALPRRSFQLPAPALLLQACFLAVLISPSHATDTASPTITIAEPANNANLSSLGAVSGTGSDDTALAGISLGLIRQYSGFNEYYNSTTGAWTTASTALPVIGDPVLSTHPTQTTWSLNTAASGYIAPDAASLPRGRYYLQAFASDTSNKNSNVTRNFTVGTTDSTAPSLTMTDPSADVTTDTIPATWSGTVQDDASGSGVGYVRIQLYRRVFATGETWNGTSWTNAGTWTQLVPLSAPDANGVRTWSFTWGSGGHWALPTGDNLRSGKYYIQVDGFDRYLNQGSVTRTLNIVPVDTTAPQNTIQTPVNGTSMTSLPASFSGYCVDPLVDGSASGLFYAKAIFSRSWAPAYWNGSAWTNSYSEFTLPLSTPDAEGHCTWNFTNLPGTALVSSGQYLFRVTSVDYYGNNTTTAANFYIGSADTTSPSLSISTPSNNAVLTSLSSITGSMSDTGSGVATLECLLTRNRGGVSEAWTGTAWSTVVPLPRLSVPVGTPDTNGNISWSVANAFSSGGAFPSGANLTTGGYSISMFATDFGGNVTTATRAFQVPNASGQGDTTAPTVSITSPAASAVVESLSGITGTAADTGSPLAAQTGLDSLQVSLVRVLSGGNLFWNGTGWQSLTATLSPSAESGTSVNWTRTGLPSGTNLPSGSYQVRVSAIDLAGNLSSVASVNFTVNHKPVAQNQNVTLSGHHGRPGENRSITLTATDAESDALTYEILATPQHGILTGTAPDLIYTPEADYFGADSFTFRASDASGPGNTATVSLNVSSPSQVDLLVKNSADLDYTGDDVLSTDGTNETVEQTVLAGSTAVYIVKAQKDSPDYSIPLKISGLGTAEGWTVRYFDAVTNGLDITDDATDLNGWNGWLANAGREFRVEVTPPAILDSSESLTLMIRAAAVGDFDVVKCVTTGKSNTHAGITAITKLEPGEGAVTTYGDKVRQNFLVTNQGTTPAHYQLSCAGTPGWIVSVLGPPTLDLAPGESASVSLEATAQVPRPDLEVPLTCDAILFVTSVDEAGVATGEESQLHTEFYVQYLDRLEWSQDGEHWNPVTAPIPVYQYEGLALRVVKGVPTKSWPDCEVLYPTWERGPHLMINFPGEVGWFHFETPTDTTPETITVRCGTVLTAQVEVLPEVP